MDKDEHLRSPRLRRSSATRNASSSGEHSLTGVEIAGTVCLPMSAWLIGAGSFLRLGVSLSEENIQKIITSDHRGFAGEYCKWIEPPVRRNEPLNARNRAGYCERESHPTIFIYRINLLYNEVACLRA